MLWRATRAITIALALAAGSWAVASAQNGSCSGGACQDGSGGGGIPTIGTSFTTDIVSTKADAHFIMIPPTAGDTPFAAGLCDDAGGDDDDAYQVSTTSTPCATGVTRFQVTATSPVGGSGSLLFYPAPASAGTLLRVYSRGGNDIALETAAQVNNAHILDFRIPSNGSIQPSCITYTLNSTTRWEFNCSTNGFGPVSDNAYDLGSSTNRLRTIYAATSLNMGLTAAAATIRPQAPTSVGNVGANSCGTTAATITGTNTAGKVTVGATSGTQCRVTFSSAWTNAPSCVANNNSTGNIVRAPSTTTTFDMIGTFAAGDVISYQCLGF